MDEATRRFHVLSLFVMLLLCSPFSVHATEIPLTNTSASVYFSPRGGATELRANSYSIKNKKLRILGRNTPVGGCRRVSFFNGKKVGFFAAHAGQ